MSSMIDYYFQVYQEKTKEYGKDTVILHQTGSFYEIYDVNNTEEQIGNAKRMSKILEMKYANKKGDTSKNSRVYPNFIGFTTSILSKYLSILLRNGFTVIIIDQLEQSSEKKDKLVKRGITKIYSPSLLPTDLTDGDFNLVSIIFDINFPTKKTTKKNSSYIQKMNVSICCINNNNNTTDITENSFTFIPNDLYTLNLSLENISRILYRCNPKELQIGFLDNLPDNVISKEIKQYFSNNYEMIRFNDIDNLYKDVDYQYKYLSNTYEHINFGLLNPVEYFQLESLSAVNLLYILKFIEKHDISYVKNLTIPKLVLENNFLVLELSTLAQLNVLNSYNSSSSTSVFDIINHTKTSIGKRHLKNLLCKPFKDPEIINKRYTITEELRLLDKNNNNTLNNNLNDILDIEKLHRKMSISELHQFEFVSLNENYLKILNLIEILNNSQELKELILDDIFNQELLIEFNSYISQYNKTFDLTKMTLFSLNSGRDELENYFNKGVIKELDIIQNKIDILENERNEFRLSLDKLINPEHKSEFIKLIYTECEGYSFTCTKIRYQLLLQKLNTQSNWKVKQTNSSVKFIPIELDKLSNEILCNRDLLSKKITINYKNTLLEYYSKYNYIFSKLKELIEIVDVCNSNLKCSQKYNYTKPEIQIKDQSFLEIEEIRHLIIENLGKEYISNNITLDSSSNGMLVYGINSSGKSSLLRAIGISTIMAQSGLYVPCKSFKFSPFNTIISQVDLSDNIFSGKSSFINEIMGLKRIIQCSDSNTLVLVDELCKGTENNSSIALVSAVILQLMKRNTKLFFTTHIHEIPKIQDIINLDNKLKICHLSVNVVNNNIIYERKLNDGSGSSLYGLEVAKSLLECTDLMDKAFEIRNKLIDNSKPIKKSTYNRKKIIDKCEICNSTKQLEVDHWQDQSTADKNGFLKKGIHKNHISNLCTLCHECHLQKTLGNIKIHGYKDSLNGKFLDWEKI